MMDTFFWILTWLSFIGQPLLLIAMAVVAIQTIGQIAGFLGGRRPEPPVLRATAMEPAATIPQASLRLEDNSWVEYAKANPEVTLQMMEKLDIVDGYFAAERHMKMSGPVSKEKPYPHFTPAQVTRAKRQRIS